MVRLRAVGRRSDEGSRKSKKVDRKWKLVELCKEIDCRQSEKIVGRHPIGAKQQAASNLIGQAKKKKRNPNVSPGPISREIVLELVGKDCKLKRAIIRP